MIGARLLLLLQGGGRGTTNRFIVTNEVSHDGRRVKYEGEGWNSAAAQRGRVGMSKTGSISASILKNIVIFCCFELMCSSIIMSVVALLVRHTNRVGR